MARYEQSRDQIPEFAPESLVLMELEARRLRNEYIAAWARSTFSRARIRLNGVFENVFNRSGHVSREV